MTVLVGVQSALTDALILAASGGALRSCISCSSISATITEALEVFLGLHEPQLVQLLRVCISPAAENDLLAKPSCSLLSRISLQERH